MYIKKSNGKRKLTGNDPTDCTDMGAGQPWVRASYGRFEPPVARLIAERAKQLRHGEPFVLKKTWR